MKNTLFTLLFIGLTTVLSAQKHNFTPEDLLKLKRLSGAIVSPDGKQVFYQSTSYSIAENKGTTTGYLLNLETNKTREFFPAGSSVSNVMWDAKNTLWYLRNGEKGSKLVNINPMNFTAEKVIYNFEEDIEGFVFSPDQKYIATLQSVKIESTIQDKYPDLTKTQAHLEDNLMYRHWNAWNTEMALHLFVYEKVDYSYTKLGDVMPNEKFAAVNPPFGGIDDVTFSKDGKFIYYSTKKKKGKEYALSTNSEIYKYDITKKTTETISTALGYDNSPKLNSSGSKVAYLSMARNGFEADKNRIFMQDVASKKTVDVTASMDVSVESFSWHPGGQIIYFIAGKNGTKQVFEITMANGKIRQVTSDQCDIVGIQVLKDKIIAERQSMVAPTDLWEINIKTGAQKQITTINQELMSTINLPEITQRWIKTTDGKKMLTWVILPPNFDKTKKYPALLYCQGGPQSMVSQYFSYRWNFLLMSSNDYVVVAPNRRGLPGFGQEWNDAISKDWGGQAMRDYLVAIDSVVASSPYINKDKLGAVGASYGGYSVYYLAGIHNNRFKTFVSHCGLFNLESWYGTTEELFFADWDIGGPYWETKNKDLYTKNSPHLLVDKWNTPMLVIHGGKDFRVPESEGMQAFQALQLKGISSQFLHFPDEGHWITKPQNSLLWNRTFFEWLGKDLK